MIAWAEVSRSIPLFANWARIEPGLIKNRSSAAVATVRGIRILSPSPSIVSSKWLLRRLVAVHPYVFDVVFPKDVQTGNLLIGQGTLNSCGCSHHERPSRESRSGRTE